MISVPSKQRFQHLQAVVLDWAGTTVDFGSRAPAAVFREVFRRRGVEITEAEARGPMGMAKLDHLVAITEMPAVAERWRRSVGRSPSKADIVGMYSEFMPLQKEVLRRHGDVIDGADLAIAELRHRGLKVGSTTGYTRELLEIVRGEAAARGHTLDVAVSADDVPAGRPAPWLLLEAARQLGVTELWRVVKVDDTPVGVEAGKNASAWSVGVLDSGNEIGLSPEEWRALSPEERQRRRAQAAARLNAAGADRLVETVAQLPAVLEEFEDRLARGERPMEAKLIG